MGVLAETVSREPGFSSRRTPTHTYTRYQKISCCYDEKQKLSLRLGGSHGWGPDSEESDHDDTPLRHALLYELFQVWVGTSFLKEVIIALRNEPRFSAASMHVWRAALNSRNGDVARRHTGQCNACQVLTETSKNSETQISRGNLETGWQTKNWPGGNLQYKHNHCTRVQ